MKLVTRLCAALTLIWIGGSAQAQTPAPAKAAAATELPLGAWGPYSRTNGEPCCLADRLLAQLFAFPIVIGQRREEMIFRQTRTADGKTRLRPERAVLERRAMGLSPMEAAADDHANGDKAFLNRHARVVEADAEGLLWSAQIPFEPAGLAQEVATPPGADPPAPAEWGAGMATVECFPAFADPTAEGLLIRVTLTNRSAAPETYYVDLLGGMSGPAPQFAPEGLTVDTGKSVEDGVTIQHAKCPAIFALASDASRYAQTTFALRTYRVSDAYFAPEGAMTQRDATGIALPCGLIAPGAAANPPQDKGRKTAQAQSDNAAPPAAAGQWGLTRVDDITLGPGESATLFLCVGVGKDKDAARDSAQTLLSLADDATILGQPRVGAYTKAVAAHRKAGFVSGDAVLDRLMAQSLVNVPFTLFRRVGVGSRQDRPGRWAGIYQPTEGGSIALGWIAYRPDWAATQLNAWFLSSGNPDKLPPHPIAVPPINLFALWELYQSTHDREMLEHFYPFAHRRYRELLSAGRPNDTTWLFSWQDSALRKAQDPTLYSPDYSAYVIRAAKILRRIATILGRPAAEIQDYTRDITEATRALNATLWDAGHGLYVSRSAASAGAAAKPEPARLNDLLPLLAGSEALSAEQRAALLKTLTDPATFWSEAGLRSVSKADPAYRAGLRSSGPVAFGLNWLLWKALLDLGETTTARQLADALLQGYHKAQTEAGFCPEWLDGDTGAAGGVTDYSGDACVLLALQAAYHRPGTISSGWDTDLLGSRYDAVSDTLHLAFRTTAAGKNALLCVMGKPNAHYTLNGALTGSVTSDAAGVLTLTPPDDSSTRQLDIAPAAPGAAQ